MKALITGATGLIGQRLAAHFDSLVILSRNPQRAQKTFPHATIHAWQPESECPPPSAFAGVDTVFHLAGEPVASGRWSNAKKHRIRDSRVLGTRHLVKTLTELEQKPSVLISSSAVGYYGDCGDQELHEGAPAGHDFLADVCRSWEVAAQHAAPAGLRVVCIRTGLVLAKHGGALQKMLPPFKLGLGGRLGDGQHWMPWIHLDDLVGLLLHASRTDTIRGPVNGTAPNPVRNAEFTRLLAQAIHRPAIFPAPRIALRLALGEMSDILFASQRATPHVAQQTGYTFQYPKLQSALSDLLA